MATDNETQGGTNGQLLALLERYERLDAEKQTIADDQKELIAEVTSSGFEGPIFRKLLKIRKDPEKFAEEAAKLNLYMADVGMQVSLDFGGAA
jgi:uncharacterized protein (UPF0335 family)